MPLARVAGGIFVWLPCRRWKTGAGAPLCWLSDSPAYSI